MDLGEFNFQEWLEKAKQDPKVAAQPVVVIIALIILAYKFLYLPQKVVLAKELKKNKGVQDQIRGLESAVANIEEVKMEVNDLKKSWSEVETRCYKKEEAPLFLQDLRELGKQADVNFKSITPFPAIPKTFETLSYELYPVKVMFLGNFKQLGLLLRAFEKHPKVIAIDLPTLEPDASGTFKFDLTPTTVLLNQPPQAAPPPDGG